MAQPMNMLYRRNNPQGIPTEVLDRLDGSTELRLRAGSDSSRVRTG